MNPEDRSVARPANKYSWILFPAGMLHNMVRLPIGLVLLTFLVAQNARAQSKAPKLDETAEIEFKVIVRDVDLFGRFMCTVDSICSFMANDLVISFFPTESFVGITLRSEAGGASLSDARGRENLSIGYNAPIETIALYEGGTTDRTSQIGTIKVLAKGP